MEKEYLLKEIVFSLREEFLKFKTELNILKQYVSKNDVMVHDFTFWLDQHIDKKQLELVCYIIKKRNLLEKISNKITKKSYESSFDVISLLKDSNGKYSTNDDSYIRINDDSINEFDRQFSKILTSDFIKFMLNQYAVLYSESFDYNFSVIASKIELAIKKEILVDSICNYIPIDDTLSIVVNNQVLSENLIKHILNIKFPKCMFSEYYQQVIEANNFIDKTINIIGDISNCPNVRLQIIDDSKKLILKKM